MEDEIYVICVCGELVNKEAITQHVEDCLKDEFVKKLVCLKISSRYRGEGDLPPTVCAKCTRCGHPMNTKDEGTLVTFYPLVNKSLVTCCSHTPQKCSKMQEFVCRMCNFSCACHQVASENDSETAIGNLESDKEVLSDNAKNSKCRKRKPTMEELLECDSDADKEHDGVPEDGQHSDGIPSGPTCKQFHVAILPNYEDSRYPIYSLLLQILNSSSSSVSVSTQTDLAITVDAGVQVRIRGVYPEEVEKLLAENKEYSLPDFDPTAEAAYRSHLSTLIPCTHCSRTFSPDRILKHISCCIERPKTRAGVTPTDGRIKR